MNRQQNLNSLSYHITDDHRGLGRDDPVWPHYINEAEKWDAALVDGWNKSMDVTLLFAALFSAIVTAFLIESYQDMKPDNAEITAAGILVMLEYVRAASAGQRPNITDAEVPSIASFQPTTRALLINSVWFLSLTLSITVALLAMLVKQWGEGYRSGGGLAPPCIQARIRQARYNRLKNWRTEDIVVSLPLLMHVALGMYTSGLFLLGLILFLLDLNQVVLIPVAIVVGTSLLIYITTTLLPLFVAFCPYNTPLSSRRMWGFFCKVCNLVVTGKWGRNPSIPSCQLKEKSLCENTTPDYLTTQALEWLIQHSNREAVDAAIKSISGADLDIKGWALLAGGSLVSVVAQKFTAICSKALGEDSGTESKPTPLQRDAYLYGHALVNISSHAELIPVSHNGVTGYTTKAETKSQLEMALDEEQVQAVENGLLRLSSSQNDVVSAYGIISLSSWYTSTSRSNQTREKWKFVLNKLIELVSSINKDVHNTQPQTPSSTDPDILMGLVKTLAVEVSHWRWELSRKEMIELTQSIVSLYRTPLVEGPAREGMAAVLAVFALLFNDYQEIQRADGTYLAESFLKGAMELYEKRTEEYTRQHGDFYTHTSKPQRAKRRPWRAQSAALLCLTDREYLGRYSDELMLFGLAGLLDSFAELEISPAGGGGPYSVAQIVANQLTRIPITSHSQATTLPWILPSTFDLKLYTVDVITRIISPSPLRDQQGQLNERDKASLLQFFSEKDIWADFGHQVIMPIIKLLDCSDIKLRTQCLIALNDYCLGVSPLDGESTSESYPNPIDWRFIFSFGILHRLIRIVEEGELVSRALSALDSVLGIIPPTDEEATQQIRSLIKGYILDGSLEAFSRNILCRAGYSHFRVLREQVFAIPRTLDARGPDDARVLSCLQNFCHSHDGESGIIATILVGLKPVLNMNNTER